MPREIDAILEMLSAADVELQCAAARVLGELRHGAEEIVRKLGRALADGPSITREYALRALARIGGASALRHIIQALAQPDPIRAKAREALVAAGPDVLPLLEPFLDKKAAELRMAVVETLGQMRSKESLELLLACMKDEDYEVVKAATALVRSRIDAMTEKERKEVFTRCAKLLGSAEAKKNRNAAVAAIRLLGHLHDPAGVNVLLKFAGAKEPSQVRANALMALAHFTFEAKAAVEVAATLLPMLEDEDYANVVTHALAVLTRVAVPRGEQKRLEKLLDSPHHSVRLFAAHAMGTTGAPRSADLLLTMLDNPDPKTAEEAARALQNPSYAKPVLAAFGKFETPPQGWILAQILKGQGAKLEGAARLAISKRFLAALEAGKEEAKIYFEVLRAADPARVRDLLLEKGRKLRQTKKAEAAVRFLALVNRDDLVTPDVTYEMALARLDGMNLDVTRPSSDSASPVNHLAHLLRNPEFPLLKRLKAEKPAISPAALLYLGFQLTERAGGEREFGGEVLKLLVAKYPRAAEAKTAKAKLRTEGLE